MKNKTVTKAFWTCCYCGYESKNLKEADRHNAFCKKSPSNRNFRIISYFLFRFGFWPIIIIGAIYFIYSNYMNSIYDYESWVYACPNSYNSKCYKVKADINSGECEPVEQDFRGNSGGECTDPYVESIFFENGGHITFDYCDLEKKDKWTCYPENSNDGVWNLQLAEVIKVKK